MPGLGLCADQTSHQTLSTSSCFKYQTEQQKTAMGRAFRSTLKRSSTTFRTRRTSQPLFYFFDVSPVRNLVRGSDVEPELDGMSLQSYPLLLTPSKGVLSNESVRLLKLRALRLRQLVRAICGKDRQDSSGDHPGCGRNRREQRVLPSPPLRTAGLRPDAAAVCYRGHYQNHRGGHRRHRHALAHTGVVAFESLTPAVYKYLHT